METAAPAAVFGRFQAYDVGSWPDSAAVGDFTGDGRNDVALSTSHYGEDDNNGKVFLFVQGADGSLTRQGRYDTTAGTPTRWASTPATSTATPGPTSSCTAATS